jgi:outer membrane receptor protein involved in Fe transport
MMNTKGALRAFYLAGAALCATLPMQAASAQAEAGANYDVPAQALSETLRAIARTAGREIIFGAQAVEGLQAPPLKGRFTFEEAIRRAIGTNGLMHENRAGAVLIRVLATADSATPGGLVDAITVTGTRIRGARSASPVTVTTRRTLEEAGIADLAGFTRFLPQNFTGGQNPGVAGGGQQGGQSNINNSAALNLRGLGPDATLTLVNGHRLAYDVVNQGVDISAIPLGAIERIEVIAEGASALYGSDAVGGVANIILRRDFDGLETTARISGSTEGGNFRQQYSMVGGARWTSGGFMAAGDFSGVTPIYADQRDYTRSLDPSLTLTLRSRQLSGVVAGHQRLSEGVVFEIDSQLLDRRSRKQSPFLPNAPATSFGLVTRPDLRSFAVTPTLRIDLPAGWQGSIGATRAVSRTSLDSRFFSNGAMTPSRLIYENRMTSFEVGAEGPLFQAPGGDARLAIGAGHRSLVLDADARQMLPDRVVTLLDFVETRKVLFGYGELSVPLLGANTGALLVHRLNLSAALRYERYNRIDEVATPKLGLVYQPHPDVTFRSSWGRSFKAPTLFQLNQGFQGALLPGRIFDPQPTPPLNPGAGVLLLGGGRPGLRSERASTWSASLELRPRILDGLRLRGDYFRIDYRERIGSPLSGTLSALANPIFRDLITFNPTAEEVNALIAMLPQGLSNQTGAPFNPANVGAIIDGALRNTARVRAQGVDLTADYPLELGAAQRLLLTAAASYLESDQQLTLTQPTIQLAGVIFQPPHWRARGGASWESRKAGLSAFLSYVGGTRDNRFADTPGPGAFVTLDLTARLRTGETGMLRNMEVSLSALNLLNEQPDMIRNSDPAAPSYDSTNQSPLGRVLSIAVRKTW